MKKLKITALLVLMSGFLHQGWSQLENNYIDKIQVAQATNNVIAFLENTNKHETLLKAIGASDLNKVLSGNGPFTILAPTDAAFKKLSKEALQTLLLDDNKEYLKTIVAYHVIPGYVNTASMSKAIFVNNGEANYKTLNGSIVTVFIKEGILAIEDENGNESLIETPDKQQSNGYVHIVDTVILPN